MRLFSPQSRQLVGIDISATSVKLVHLARTGGRYTLKSYGIEAFEPGWVVDRNIAQPDEISGAISRLTQATGVSIKDVATAVSGSAVITKVIELDESLTEDELESQIRLDAEQYIPYPLSEVNMDFEVLGPSTTTPGLNRVLLAASRSENVEQRVESLQMAGLTAKVMDIESHAIERAFKLLANDLPGNPEIVALVDVGHSQTTLYIAKEGDFIYSREQSFGGKQLTDEIQSRYGMNYQDATAGKRDFSLPEGYRDEILMPFVENTVAQIGRALQFYFSSSQYNTVDHVVLCGGTASLPMLASLVQQKTGAPTSVANPFKHMQLDPKINAEALAGDAPSLMAACGLAMRSFD